MQRFIYQVLFASVWVLIISFAAAAAGLTSIPTLAAAAIVALMPAVMVQRLWRDPPQTMSEAIRESRR